MVHDKPGRHNERATDRSVPRQPRSCTECCRRKVRCDRLRPCNHCVKHNSDCFFPTSRKSARRPQKAVESTKPDTPRDQIASENEVSVTLAQGPQRTSGLASSHDARHDQAVQPRLSSTLSHQTTLTNNGENASQLNLSDGRSRYVGNQFWVSMSGEVEEMRDVLDDSSPEADALLYDDETRTASTPGQVAKPSSLFTPLTDAQSLDLLLPDTEQLLTMFDTYQENVDPVARIFHRPFLRRLVTKRMGTSGRLEKHVAPILFSICFAAVVSIDETECMKIFKDSQQGLLARYRYAMEQSLAHAGFVESANLNILAAFVLFLLCVRRHDHSRFVSSMLGIAIRNAQAMGLHKDGTHFKLSAHETEIRRRIWWHICILDLRSAEDHGFEPSLFDHNYDTKFPLNLDDDDLDPESLQLRPEKSGCSSMTFCLLRCEMTVAIKRLHYQPPGAVIVAPVDKEAFVEKTERHFHETYIRHCDASRSIEWVSATWARLMLAKLWLAVYNPRQQEHEVVPLRSRRLAFAKAVDVLELADTLESSPRASRWRWLFLTHTQWHAVVFVLAYLCVMPSDPLARQAWNIVIKVHDRWSASSSVREGMLWKPLSRLMAKAQRIHANVADGLQENAGASTATGRHAESTRPNSINRIQLDSRHSPSNMPHNQAQANMPLSSTSGHATYSTSYPSDCGAEVATNRTEPSMTFIGNFGREFDPNTDVHDLAPDIFSSEWDAIMHDLHFDVGNGESSVVSNVHDFLPKSLKSVWDTL